MLLINAHPDHGAPLTAEDAQALGPAAARDAGVFFERWQAPSPTPLHKLRSIARLAGVSDVRLKDEGSRELGSFKALGGAHAVARLVLEESGRQLGRPLDAVDLQAPEVRAIASAMTFCCATAGNHGRSVARAAALVGAKAAIFVGSGVTSERAAAMARLGAQILHVEGSYDDSVRAASRAAAEHGWILVSDTSWPGYERIPRLVMQGYTVMLREALDVLPELPTHVFVQAGVGGLAAAIAGHLLAAFGERRPRMIVVEPENAACILASAEAGRATAITTPQPTIMAMLDCREPSLVAWRILSRAADAFVTIADGDAVDAMRRLARPAGEDPPIVAGESGAAGLAAVLRIAADPAARTAIGLGQDARVLTFNTETATDPGVYRSLVGMDPISLRGG